jgi:hypothetical protein
MHHRYVIYFFFLCFEVMICSLPALFLDEFFSTCIVAPLVEFTAFSLSSIMAGNLVGDGLQLFPTHFFVFSTRIVVPFVELTPYALLPIMAGNLVGVGL